MAKFSDSIKNILFKLKNIVFSSSITIKNDNPEIILNNTSDNGSDVAIKCDKEDLIIYEPEDSNKEWLRIKDDTGLYLSLKKLITNNGSDFNTEINENDITLNAGDDGGKAQIIKTNSDTTFRIEQQDKDGNVLSYIKLDDYMGYLGNNDNRLAISKTSYRFNKLHGSDTKIKADSDLDTGWYTIATFGSHKGRGMARFMILDIKSNHHQVIDFQATHMYGVDASNNITVFQQAYYSNQVITKIRIKEKDTYDGCVVQVKIDQDKNDLTVHYLGHNSLEDGWKLKNFIPDDTDPGDVDNYDDMTEKVRVNMTNKQAGMFMGRDIFFREGKGISFMNDTDSGVNVSLHAEGEDFFIRETEDSNKEWLKLKDDDDLYVFGKKVFRDIAHNLSEDGYQKLGGSGLIIQWCTFTSNTDDDQDVDFPISFPNEVLNIVLSPIPYKFLTNVDTDGFTCNRWNDTDGKGTVYVVAIGY